MNAKDEIFLRQAIQLAREARANGERPFGAVLVQDGQLVAQAGDQCRALSDPTAHAELRLISTYCQASGKISLEGHTLYSLTEPCVMCSGAIKWAVISRVVFSVPQAMLQTVSGGLQKPSCDSLVNTGQRHIEVSGPYLLEEGFAVYHGFDFDQHRQTLFAEQG
jgi:tRNA(Arg) A34 adenosine deaminase TadA